MGPELVYSAGYKPTLKPRGSWAHLEKELGWDPQAFQQHRGGMNPVIESLKPLWLTVTKCPLLGAIPRSEGQESSRHIKWPYSDSILR